MLGFARDRTPRVRAGDQSENPALCSEMHYLDGDGKTRLRRRRQSQLFVDPAGGQVRS
jgi:hypothetical protein